jgi:pimeloyl-ACP methyl ester carboxylesterase
MREDVNNLEPLIHHAYAQIGGVRLHYAEGGQSHGELVIFLHGFPECWYSWRHQLLALASSYHVVAPDMRGYNLSDKPERIEDYKMDVLVQDVLGLIHHFNVNRATIVGHDWGAAIAWAIAENHPSYVTKLVAMQVPPVSIWRANMSLRQALRSWYMLFFQLPRIPEWWISRRDFAALERTFKKTTTRANVFSDADIAVYKEALRKPGALTSAINYYRANFTGLFRREAKDESTAQQKRVRVPTLFIYGERDFAIIPETVRDVRRYVAASYRELRFAQSNHWVQNESAREVNAALKDFLTS